MRPHDLWHTCASIMLAHGIPLPTVQEVLRHKDAYTTARMYSHALPRWHRKTVERLEKAISADGRQLGGNSTLGDDQEKI
ncbi:hypothetical protein TAMC210_19120 [Thermanaeromonas sp. C210]|nr:hypothetical protein TAMC210_19120 [Thermanaeromonas sp. C210]